MFGVHMNGQCYKRIVLKKDKLILQRNYSKMTILWSFSYNFFVKFHGKKFGIESQHDGVYSNLCYNKACYVGRELCTRRKGLHCTCNV